MSIIICLKWDERSDGKVIHILEVCLFFVRGSHLMVLAELQSVSCACAPEKYAALSSNRWMTLFLNSSGMYLREGQHFVV